MNNPDTPKQKIRLTGYLDVTHWITYGSAIFFGVIVFFFKDSLPFVRYPWLLIWSWVAAITYTTIIRLLGKRFNWTKGYYIFNLGWIVVSIFSIYGTGGANSAFLLMLLTPVIISAWNLDYVVAGRIGITMLVLGALLLLADPQYMKIPGFTIEYFMVLIIAAILMYDIYRLIKETLLQKYEKEEAKKKYDELLETDRLKTDFVTVISHQLRTPLTGARWGLAAAIEKENISPDLKDILKRTEDRINDSITIVNGMISSIDSEDKFLHKVRQTINIDTLVRDTVKKLDYLIKSSNVSFSFGRISSCVVLGNEDALSAAFSNIIDNAVRYAPGGKVSISVVPEGGKAVVTIADNGIGIAPEDQPYMFKRFYRGKNAIGIEPNSSGIGLFISKRIIEQHGGSISFVSELGKGTTMTITLPLKAETAS